MVAARAATASAPTWCTAGLTALTRRRSGRLACPDRHRWQSLRILLPENGSSRPKTAHNWRTFRIAIRDLSAAAICNAIRHEIELSFGSVLRAQLSARWNDVPQVCVPLKRYIVVWL